MPENPLDAGGLLRQGILAAAAGDHEQARELLARAIRQEPYNASAWLWLSAELSTVKEKAFCLKQALALEPDNQLARQALNRLQERGWRPPAPRVTPAAPPDHAPEQPQATEGEPARSPLPDPADTVTATAQLGEPAAPSQPSTSASALNPTPALAPASAGTPASAPASTLTTPFGLNSDFLLIALLGATLLAIIALVDLWGLERLPAFLSPLRLGLGLAFVLFAPGYAFQAALFARDDALDGPARLALSFGLSVAVVPPLALVLDRLPWGIRLWPIAVGEAAVITVLTAVAWWRRHRLPPAERFHVTVDASPRRWWAAQDRGNRILYGILAGALLLALASAAVIVLSPKPGEQFTEFYVLGPEGLAENYPREAAPGESLSVTAGVHNLEGVQAEYRIEALVGETVVGGAGPFSLATDETWEGEIVYALPTAGADQQVDFFLYRDGSAEPYRSLRLWIDILPEEDS